MKSMRRLFVALKSLGRFAMRVFPNESAQKLSGKTSL